MEFPIGPASAQSERARRLRSCRRRGRRFRYVVALALLLAVGFVVRLASVGLPREWVDRLAAEMSTDDYAVELENVTFSLARMRLRVGTVRVCPRGVVSEPLVRASGAEVRIRPHWGRPDASWVESVAIDDLSAILPPAGEGGGGPVEQSEPEAPLALPDVPPVTIRCARANLLGLSLHRLEATVSINGGVLSLEDAAASFEAENEPAQRVAGSFRFHASDRMFESDARGSLDPDKLSGMLDALGVGGVSLELDKFFFPDRAPDAELAFRFAPEREERLLRVSLRSDGGYYNQVPISSYSGVVTVGGTNGWNRIEIDPLHIDRPEGSADARIVVDLQRETVSFEGRSGIDPLRLVGLIGLLDASSEMPVAFDNPSETAFSGTYGFGAESVGETDLRFSVRSPALTAAGLRFARLNAAGSMRRRELRIDRADADVLDGTLSLDAGLAFPTAPGERTAFRLAGTLRDVSYSECLAAFAEEPAEANPGRIDLSLALLGPAEDVFSGRILESSGTAELSIRNAGLLRIPFFAGLTDLLSNYVPGADLLVDQDALAVSGELRNGRIDVESLDLSGGAFSVSGSGRVWMDGELDMTMDVRLFNRETWLGAGVYWISAPILKLFAIRLSGRIDDPHWSSARLTSGSERE